MGGGVNVIMEDYLPPIGDQGLPKFLENLGVPQFHRRKSK